MRNRVTAVVFVSAAIAGGCTAAGGTPATAPPNTIATTVITTVLPTTTLAPASTQAPETTTTTDRLAEIQAIFEDLERRRLQAIYSGDREAFLALFADTPYREKSLEAFELISPGIPPELTIEIVEVLKDDMACLVVMASTSSSQSANPPLIDTTTFVSVDGSWRYAYVEAGRGDWLCIGPHPLSG